MERKFQEAFAGLNQQQRRAVETIDGPVLVIAGPGTGKTQLISARVGYILQNTDTPADAILLLTFTEAGVQAMRERLNILIGKAAYDVQLNTYHAFGGEIFRRYPDYFEGAQLNLIEELGADSLLRSIVAKLPYSNPLKFADAYINDIKNFISEAKRALLSPDDVAKIAADNLDFIAHANRRCRSTLGKVGVVSKKTVPVFEELLAGFKSFPNSLLPNGVQPLVRYAQDELEGALDDFARSGKTTTLSEWKRRWLAKDTKGRFIIEGRRANERLKAAAGIYKQYRAILSKQKLYDYDDMILHAIDALETNPELKYSLAERYSYIMLDEFQDTNPAQFRLVQLLTDHPVHEGRPNILAVGDDDQAIYAFQGADHANMSDFLKRYKQVNIISLKENYRSWPDLLEASQNIARQIQSRLTNQFESVTKELVAVNKLLPEPPKIEAREFRSDAAQYDWIAAEIRRLVEQDVAAGEIAILAPKHRYLEPLLPYLAQHNLAVHYERRENILDDPLVHQLEQMSRLVVFLATGDEPQASSLWPEILSYDFWRVSTEKIWQISWQSRQSHEPWTALILNDELLKPVATFFLKLANLLSVTSLEQQIDILIGTPGTAENVNLPMSSPLYDFYFAKEVAADDPVRFNNLISNLNILRSRLRDWRAVASPPANLRSLVEFIDNHRAANINILNTSPYYETAEAVNMLTAYGAKGREFQAVFIIAAVDEVWGSASRNQGYRLSLPANLNYIRYQGASEDERLRLLYVAATRARTRLYLTSYTHDLAGKSFSRLKYLNADQDEKGRVLYKILPERFNRLISDEHESIGLLAATDYWTNRHTPPFHPKLREVLKPRLQSYQLSATDLNNFMDIVSSGPNHFFMRCLLRFPVAPAAIHSFGTALHNTLRFAGQNLRSGGKLPALEQLMEIFKAQLNRIDLTSEEQARLLARGQVSLRSWLQLSGPQLQPTDRYEYDFNNEGARVGSVRLSGKVDRIIIDEKRQAITVIDYKTGKAYRRWQPGVIKLHLFRQQLLVYKLLIENSARFRRYKVEKGVIEFVEPDEDGRLNRLELDYNQAEIDRTVKLVGAVWKRIQDLNFPDTNVYSPTLAGIRQFEDDLIKTGPKENADS